MTRLVLNKSTLSRKLEQLESYRHFLPSLDRKRRQLLAQRGRVRRAHETLRDQLVELEHDAAARLPMLAAHDLDAAALVRTQAFTLGEESLAGLRLPLVQALDVVVEPYSELARPHWLDELVERLRRGVELRLRERIERRRRALVERALRITTQRVNLFEKVLIPRTEAEIRRIRLFLAEQQRAAVVRAKLAKARRSVAP